MIASMVAYIPAPPSNGFHLGPLFFHLYGLMIAIGILFAVALARRRWAARGHDPVTLERPMIWAVVAGFVGGRIGYVITHSGDFRGRWWHVIAIWEGGLALYGGLTFGILTGIWVCRRRGLPVLQALDAAIPGIPLAQAFGRWGNYFNQELFGTPTKLPWGLKVDPVHVPDKYVGFTTFHPTFLYESLYDLLVVGVLLWLDRRRKLRAGSIVLAYLALYAFGRFFLELLRTDTTFRLLGLSRNAWISIGVVLGAGTWLFLRERRHLAEEHAETGAATGESGERPADGEAKAKEAKEEGEPVGVPAGERAAAGSGADGGDDGEGTEEG